MLHSVLSGCSEGHTVPCQLPEKTIYSSFSTFPNLLGSCQITANKDHLNCCVPITVRHRDFTSLLRTYAAVVPKISTFLALVSVASASEHRTEKIIITPRRTTACLTTYRTTIDTIGKTEESEMARMRTSCVTFSSEMKPMVCSLNRLSCIAGHSYIFSQCFWFLPFF